PHQLFNTWIERDAPRRDLHRVLTRSVCDTAHLIDLERALPRALLAARHDAQDHRPIYDRFLDTVTTERRAIGWWIADQQGGGAGVAQHGAELINDLAD